MGVGTIVQVHLNKLECREKVNFKRPIPLIERHQTTENGIYSVIFFSGGGPTHIYFASDAHVLIYLIIFILLAYTSYLYKL